MDQIEEETIEIISSLINKSNDGYYVAKSMQKWFNKYVKVGQYSRDSSEKRIEKILSELRSNLKKNYMDWSIQGIKCRNNDFEITLLGENNIIRFILYF